jgi:hypothetical protein
MGFKGWICTLLLSVGVAAHAQGTSQPTEGCVSASEMSEIAQSFNQFSNLAGREYCYDGSETSHLIQGIMFMRKTAFASTMPKSTDELFTGKFASNWWQYFTGRINEFSVESDCQPGVVAFVYFFGNTMYVCPAALTSSMSSLDLASVFMHEARHIDGYPHTTCHSGPRAGMQGACDQRISDGGSYAVTVETYAQIARYANDVHPALKAYSAASAVVYADEAFDETPRIDRQDGFVVLANDGQLHKVEVNGSSVSFKALGQAPALGHLVKRAQYFVLYPDDKNLTSGYFFLNNEGTIQQTAGTVSAEYNGQTPAQRAEWVDVYLGGLWYSKVKRTEIIFGCSATSTSTQSVSTNGETPVTLIYPNGYARDTRTAQVLMASGKVFDMGCNGTTPYLRASASTFDRPMKRVYKSGSDVLGLGTDGKLYRLNGFTSTALSTSLDGRIYDLVAAQSFSFFQ